MKNDFICIPISDLLKNSNWTATRGVFSEKDVWLLKDNQQEILACQLLEEGKPPFEGVYCLLEMQSLSLDSEQSFPIKAFLTGLLN